MSILMRAGEINKRPVVTFAGEDIAEIKDIVYGANGGRVEGFTLNSRSFFGPTLKTSLPWSAVAALGPDAVMVADADALVPTQELLEAAKSAGTDGSAGGNILGSEVMTDDGSSLGTVVDVIIEVSDDPGEEADVVGYEIEPSEGMGATGRLLIPLPDTLAASGQHLIVPAAAREFVGQDLAGFGAAVHAFRARFENQLPGQQGSPAPAKEDGRTFGRHPGTQRRRRPGTISSTTATSTQRRRSTATSTRLRRVAGTRRSSATSTHRSSTANIRPSRVATTHPGSTGSTRPSSTTSRSRPATVVPRSTGSPTTSRHPATRDPPPDMKEVSDEVLRGQGPQGGQHR